MAQDSLSTCSESIAKVRLKLTELHHSYTRGVLYDFYANERGIKDLEIEKYKAELDKLLIELNILLKGKTKPRDKRYVFICQSDIALLSKILKGRNATTIDINENDFLDLDDLVKQAK